MHATRSRQQDLRRGAEGDGAQPAEVALSPGPYPQMLALAKAAGNAAMARALGPGSGRSLMRAPHSEGGDVETVEDLEALVEDRDPPPRARSNSAPAALGSMRGVPAPPLPLTESRDLPSEPSVADEEEAAPVVTLPGPPQAEATIEPPQAEATIEPPQAEATVQPPQAEAAVEPPTPVSPPVVSWPKQPTVPKQPKPLPLHPTIGDNEAFNVQAHAQFVRDDLVLASQGGEAARSALAGSLADVQTIAAGKSTAPLSEQKSAIARAETAYRPLRDALVQRQTDVIADAAQPAPSAYKAVRDDIAKARGYVRWEWAAVVAALDALEKRVKKANELDALAAVATTSVTYLKADTQLNAFTGAFARISQKQDLAQVETWVKDRHAAPNLTHQIKLISEKLSKAERDYSDITLRPDVEAAVHEPATSAQKPAKKATARAALKTLLDAGVVRKGRIIEKYADNANGAGHYGVEWSLEGTDRIVVHSHIGPNGRANDAEATHFKLRGEKLRAGTSVGMPVGWKGDALMNPDDNRNTPCPFSAQ